MRFSCCVVALFCACASQKPVDPGTGDDGTNTAGECPTDDSKDVASAVAWTAPVQGNVCPRADVDFYSVTVPAPNDLLDVSAGYGSSATRVDLSLQLYIGGTPISDSGAADTTPDDSQSNVKATFHVTPGDYVLSVRDLGDDERDDQNSYTLAFTFAKDPDTHEPNDTVANAKASDGQPGWFAYSGDKDVYKVTTTALLPLVGIAINNSAGSTAVVQYSLQKADGVEIARGQSNPGQMLVERRAVATADTYYVVLTQEAARLPDRRTEAAYTVTLTAEAEPDTHESPTRNDLAANATPIPAFTGSVVNYSASAFIGSTADRDYYRIDVTSGAPAVLEVQLSMPSTATQPAFDILYGHPGTACTTDSQCAELAINCGDDNDCELSHTCLPSGKCAGGNICLPPGQCAVPHFLYDPMVSGPTNVSTAQPLFTDGTYYVVVHDFQDDNFSTQAYSVSLHVSPEPDAYDQATRNNFYNPYPVRDASPISASRAIDITDFLRAPTGVTGYISYVSDEDWYEFKYPCTAPTGPSGVSGPITCELVFEWLQPQTDNNMRVSFLMLKDDLSIHESFLYEGHDLAAGSHTVTFGNQNQCAKCSFADERHAMGSTGYTYFLQVRDFGSNNYELNNPYRISIASTTNGCPADCSFAMGPTGPGGTASTPNYGCSCYCSDSKSCPGLGGVTGL